MKLSVNAIVQILGVIAQAVNMLSDLTGPEGKLWCAVIVSAIQGLVGVLAHFVNPDGTPAEQPYRK